VRIPSINLGDLEAPLPKGEDLSGPWPRRRVRRARRLALQMKPER